MRILLSQLVNSTNFTEANFDITNSTYFNKHYDISMQKPFQIGEGHVSVPDLAQSLSSDMKDNHFDSNAPESNSAQNADQLLRAEDVDEEMFIFPTQEAEQLDQEETKEDLQDQTNNLRSTADLLAPIIERQTKPISKPEQKLLNEHQ